MPRVAVIVLNYNGLDDTLKCLESLRSLSYRDVAVILVDNGSAVDPVPDATAAFEGLHVVRTGANLGYAGGNNRGIERAQSMMAEFVMVLNNDTLVAPSIIEPLLQTLDADPSLAIVGPIINYMDEPHVVMTDGVDFNASALEFFKPVGRAVHDERGPVLVDIVNGCCMMIRSAALQRVGAFDETLFIVHEESDLCLRMQRAGYRCAVIGQTLVWHKGSSSFKRSGRQLQRYFDARNLFYILRRHAGRVGRSRSFLRSLWPYFTYMAYRYDTELEAGQPAAARAVAEGISDALSNRRGPYTTRTRLWARLIASAFALRRKAAALKALSRPGRAPW